MPYQNTARLDHRAVLTDKMFAKNAKNLLHRKIANLPISSLFDQAQTN